MAALPHAHPMTIPSSRLSPALRYMESARVGGTMTATMLRSNCQFGETNDATRLTYRQKKRGLSHRVGRLRRNQEGHSCRERETAPYPRLHSASRLEGWLHPGEWPPRGMTRRRLARLMSSKCPGTFTQERSVCAQIWRAEEGENMKRIFVLCGENWQ